MPNLLHPLLLLIFYISLTHGVVTVYNGTTSGGSWIKTSNTSILWQTSFFAENAFINDDELISKLEAYESVTITTSDNNSPLWFNSSISSAVAVGEFIVISSGDCFIIEDIYLPNMSFTWTGDPNSYYFSSVTISSDIFTMTDAYFYQLDSVSFSSYVDGEVAGQFFVIYDPTTFSAESPQVETLGSFTTFSMQAGAGVSADEIVIAMASISIINNPSKFECRSYCGFQAGSSGNFLFNLANQTLPIKYFYLWNVLDQILGVQQSASAVIVASSIIFNNTDYYFTVQGQMTIGSPDVYLHGQIQFDSLTATTSATGTTYTNGSQLEIVTTYDQSLLVINTIIMETAVITGFGSIRTGNTGTIIRVSNLTVEATSGSIIVSLRGANNSIGQIVSEISGVLNLKAPYGSITVDNLLPTTLGNIIGYSLDLVATGAIADMVGSQFVIEDWAKMRSNSSIVLGNDPEDLVQVGIFDVTIELSSATTLINITTQDRIGLSTASNPYGVVAFQTAGYFATQDANIAADKLYITAQTVNLGYEYELVNVNGLSIVSPGSVQVTANVTYLLSPFITAGPTTFTYSCGGLNLPSSFSSNDTFNILGTTTFIFSDIPSLANCSSDISLDDSGSKTLYISGPVFLQGSQSLSHGTSFKVSQTQSIVLGSITAYDLDIAVSAGNITSITPEYTSSTIVNPTYVDISSHSSFSLGQNFSVLDLGSNPLNDLGTVPSSITTVGLLQSLFLSSSNIYAALDVWPPASSIVLLFPNSQITIPDTYSLVGDFSLDGSEIIQTKGIRTASPLTLVSSAGNVFMNQTDNDFTVSPVSVTAEDSFIYLSDENELLLGDIILNNSTLILTALTIIQAPGTHFYANDNSKIIATAINITITENNDNFLNSTFEVTQGTLNINAVNAFATNSTVYMRPGTIITGLGAIGNLVTDNATVHPTKSFETGLTISNLNLTRGTLQISIVNILYYSRIIVGGSFNIDGAELSVVNEDNENNKVGREVVRKKLRRRDLDTSSPANIDVPLIEGYAFKLITMTNESKTISGEFTNLQDQAILPFQIQNQDLQISYEGPGGIGNDLELAVAVESSSGSTSKTSIIIGTVTGFALCLLIILSIGLIIALIKRESINRKIQIARWKEKNYGNYTELNWYELELEMLLGEGAFGKVYKGSYRKAPVAIKILDGVNLKADVEQMAKDLRTECETMASVQSHPNIVQLMGAVTENDKNKLAIVTRYCAKGSVDQLIYNKTRPLPQKEKIRIALEAASGILHLHSEGVIHRDIASRNMLIGDGGQVLVSDFGMARFKSNDDDSGKTKSNIGPVKWMAPEAIMNRSYSEASDVFSFGVFLWELDTRTKPWNGVPTVEVSGNICAGKRLPLANVHDKVFADLIEECWQHDPRDRPTFEEIHAKLDKYSKSFEPGSSSRVSDSDTDDLTSTEEVSSNRKLDEYILSSTSAGDDVVVVGHKMPWSPSTRKSKKKESFSEPPETSLPQSRNESKQSIPMKKITKSKPSGSAATSDGKTSYTLSPFSSSNAILTKDQKKKDKKPHRKFPRLKSKSTDSKTIFLKTEDDYTELPPLEARGKGHTTTTANTSFSDDDHSSVDNLDLV